MAKGVTIKLEDKALNRQLKRAMKANPKETVRAVKDCTLDLASNSAQRAPVESGDLRSDCVADVNSVKVYEKQSAVPGAVIPATKALGDVGYSLPYALRQHEDLSLRHDRTDGYRRTDGTTVNMVAGGDVKFLEGPFDERKSRYIKRMEQIAERSVK
jgi:hypothetical protein